MLEDVTWFVQQLITLDVDYKAAFDKVPYFIKEMSLRRMGMPEEGSVHKHRDERPRAHLQLGVGHEVLARRLQQVVEVIVPLVDLELDDRRVDGLADHEQQPDPRHQSVGACAVEKKLPEHLDVRAS